MKRDVELIKAILLNLEDREVNPIPEQYPEEAVLYHIGLCIEAQLIHGQIVEDSDMEIRGAAMWRLTWEGHEFLDAARNAGVWNKTMEVLKKQSVAVPFTIIKALLVQKLKEKTGLEISI
jgi:hypothetical protein